jgi:hypothetical protein
VDGDSGQDFEVGVGEEVSGREKDGMRRWKGTFKCKDSALHGVGFLCVYKKARRVV